MLAPFGHASAQAATGSPYSGPRFASAPDPSTPPSLRYPTYPEDFYPRFPSKIVLQWSGQVEALVTMNSWSSSWYRSQKQVFTRASDVSFQGPTRGDVGVYTSRTNESVDTSWLYELQLSRPLPIVDISGTPLSKVLSSSKYQKAVRWMHRAIPILVRLNRINILIFGSTLFLPAHITRPWIPLLGVISLLPPLSFMLFLSVEVLVLLRKNYEFWFVSILNVVNWIGVGQVFGDFRAVVCVSFWLNSQNVISIDANYRTYQTTVKSIIMAGPSMLALVFCCSYRLIVDAAAAPTIAIGTMRMQWRQIVIFTASTLIIFMFKKAFTKVHLRRRHGRIQSMIALRSGGDRHVISCVVLCARMKLTPASTKQQLRLMNIVRKQPATATASSTQQLRLARHKSFIVDSRRVLLSEKLLNRFLVHQMRIALYVISITGLVATATTWILLLCQADNVLEAAIIAFVFSLAFVSITAALTQKDLLRLLLWNFDVMFSTAQATALALSLSDLLQWQIVSNLAVVTWWLWFVWIMMLDALTPCVAQKLRLRKLALLVIILAMSIAAACAVNIVMSDAPIFKSRLLFTLSLPRLGTYREFTDTLAVQRVVTIIGWNTRLIFELVLCDPSQLIFIRRRIEYISPYLTFSEPLQEEHQMKAACSKRWGWKQHRPVAVVPQAGLQLDQVTNGTT